MKTGNSKCKVKNAVRLTSVASLSRASSPSKPNLKILPFAFCLMSFALFLSGCAGFQVAGEIQSGRQALLIGKPESALPHFQSAAQLDSNYITDFTVFQQGVWTYVGRSYYDIGKLSEARQALEQARSRYDQDYLAKLYLGLALARDGNRERALQEVESGMKGMHDWLEWIVYNTRSGQFWDPRKEIRSEIQSDLVMISGKEIDWQKLIASGEWLGRKMEEEINLARRDEIEDIRRLTDGGGGEP